MFSLLGDSLMAKRYALDVVSLGSTPSLPNSRVYQKRYIPN